MWNYLLTHSWWVGQQIVWTISELKQNILTVFVHLSQKTFSVFLFFLIPALCFPAKGLRAALWRRSTWTGSPLPLGWWKCGGTRSWASALWRAVRNRWWSAPSHQVGVRIRNDNVQTQAELCNADAQICTLHLKIEVLTQLLHET